MSQDEFAKLFQYMQKNFNEINARLEGAAKHEGTNRVLAGRDDIRERLDTEETGRAAATAQVDRLQDWIERAVPNLRPNYDPSA